MQEIGVVKAPDVRPNCDTEVEEFLACDTIIRDDNVAIIPGIGAVDKVDGTEGRLGGGGDDGVVCDDSSRGAVDYDAAVCGAQDLCIRS